MLNALRNQGSVILMKAKRNDPCPCGSGKKYKKCCYDKDTKKGFEAKVLSSGGPGLASLFQKAQELKPSETPEKNEEEKQND